MEWTREEIRLFVPQLAALLVRKAIVPQLAAQIARDSGRLDSSSANQFCELSLAEPSFAPKMINLPGHVILATSLFKVNLTLGMSFVIALMNN